MASWDSLSPTQQEAILDGPALPPPDGVTPNFTNPSKRNLEAFIVISLCSSFVAVAALLRGYSRIFITKKLHLEDILGLLALGLFITGLWPPISFAHLPGYYVHQYDIHLRDFPKVVLPGYVAIISYFLFLLVAKTAILLEWIRLFVPTSTRTWFWWAAHIMMGLNILLYVVGTFIVIFQCTPVERLWKPWIEGSCIEFIAVDIITAAFNLAMDILIFLMPQKFIWSLKLNGYKKAGIVFVFSVGLITSVCAASRVVLSANGYDTGEFYNIGPSLLWNLSEQTCVMLVFLIPGAAPVLSLSRFVSRLFKPISHRLGGASVLNGRSSNFGRNVVTIGSAPVRRPHLHFDDDEQLVTMTDLECHREGVSEFS